MYLERHYNHIAYNISIRCINGGSGPNECALWVQYVPVLERDD